MERKIQDQTGELADARQAAEQASHTRNQFLAGISHELRTPLNAIIGFAQMLEREYFGSLAPKQREYVDDIQQSAKHLLSVITTILDMSKMSAGPLVPAPQVICLAELCRSIVALSAPLADQNGNVLTLVMGDIPANIKSDATKLRQCLLNLMGNACKFTERGRVTLEVQSRRKHGADWVLFSVSDTGIGIADESRGALFRVFSQADAMISERFGGTGLGLALTAQMAALLGGSVECESRLGVGSTFTLLVPAELSPTAGQWLDAHKPLPIPSSAASLANGA